MPKDKAKKQEKAKEQVKQTKCFRCDGDGEICDTCGESLQSCECREDEQNFSECPDCKGTGK